jgi:hypothetical protein
MPSPVSPEKEIPMRVVTVFAVLFAADLAPVDDKKTEPKGEEVSCKITFKGKPLPVGTVTFVTSDEKTKVAALIAEDGTYKAVVPAGEYKITITTLVPKKKDDKEPEKKVPELKIHPKYGDPKTTPLTAAIKEGKNELNIELTD